MPTIKFYIREGILPRGEATAPNQARYGEAHLRRLALIATLQKAGLSLAVIKQALQAMDTMDGDAPDFLAIAVESLHLTARPPDERAPDPASADGAAAMLAAMVRGRGWDVDERAPIWHDTVRALAAVLDTWDPEFDVDDLDRYAALMQWMATFELPDEWQPGVAPAEALRYVVLGTILFEPLILALRRLAHIDRGNKLRTRRRANRE